MDKKLIELLREIAADVGKNCFSPYGDRIYEVSTACAAAEQQRDEMAAQVEMLRVALKDIHDDMVERFDMESPSTNPGMKFVVKQAAEALALPNTAAAMLAAAQGEK